jgi:lysozyme
MDAKDLIKKHEGLTLVPIPDTKGKLSIGYGHDLDPARDVIPAAWTLEQAEAAFEADFKWASENCASFIHGFTLLDEVRQVVLLDMTYECVINGVLGFHKFLAAVKVGDWKEAAFQMADSLWAEQVPSRSAEDEQMMLTGEWPE